MTNGPNLQRAESLKQLSLVIRIGYRQNLGGRTIDYADRPVSILRRPGPHIAVVVSLHLQNKYLEARVSLLAS
jgi:hypothetical protein